MSERLSHEAARLCQAVFRGRYSYYRTSGLDHATAKMQANEDANAWRRLILETGATVSVERATAPPIQSKGDTAMQHEQMRLGVSHA